MKTILGRTFSFLLAAALVGGCATFPTGPSVMVLPGTSKSFEAFQADDALCRQWASQQAGATPKESVNDNLASGAAMGTLAGAGLGAAIGAASGNPGAGAAVGAGSGLVLGSAAASGPAYAAGQEAQRRYDIAYQQCMYAKGNQIPGIMREPMRTSGLPPPPPNYSAGPPAPIPPPPAGNPPPPPPG